MIPMILVEFLEFLELRLSSRKVLQPVHYQVVRYYFKLVDHRYFVIVTGQLTAPGAVFQVLLNFRGGEALDDIHSVINYSV